MRAKFITTAAAALCVLATSSPAFADDAPSDHWRLVVAGIGFAGAGTGLVLTFTSFRPDHIEGVETGIGLGLVVAGLATMGIVLGGEHHVALAPAVQLAAANNGLRSTEAPGMTVAGRW